MTSAINTWETPCLEEPSSLGVVAKLNGNSIWTGIAEVVDSMPMHLEL